LADEVENIRLVGTQRDLDEVVASHQSDGGDAPEPLLGIIPLMEGADPIRHPEEVEYWYERGLRLVWLAWDDPRYASGAWRGNRTGLTKEGHQLLEIMAEFPFILDLTHMSEKASLEALDRYEGPVAATHSNARRLVPGERQLSDSQIRRIGERDGVIGMVMCNSFLRPNYRRGDPKELVTLDHVVAHIDHICQILGDSEHVGIGSDLDGGFGVDHIPAEMESVADLRLISAHLLGHGFEQDDVANIMGSNWIRLLQHTLPH
jgi:membrane dipeptidase